MRQFHLGLDDASALNDLQIALAVDRWLPLGIVPVVGGETTVLDVPFQELVFLQPPLSKPQLKLLRIIKGHGGHGKATPIHVDGFGRPTLQVGGTECKIVLAVTITSDIKLLSCKWDNRISGLRNTLIRYSAIIHPFDRSPELLQTILQACMSRQQSMP